MVLFANTISSQFSSYKSCRFALSLARKRGKICWGSKIFLNKVRNTFASATNVPLDCKRGNVYFLLQQCFRNIVSSFAGALKHTDWEVLYCCSKQGHLVLCVWLSWLAESDALCVNSGKACEGGSFSSLVKLPEKCDSPQSYCVTYGKLNNVVTLRLYSWKHVFARLSSYE